VGNGYEQLIKVTVISRDSAAGNYSYYTRKITSGWAVDITGHHGDTAHFYELTNLSYTDSLMNQADFYQGMIVENVLDNFFTSYIHTGVDSLGIYDKWIGNYSFYVPGMFMHGDLLQPPQSFELLFPLQDPYFVRDFKPGLGITADDYSYFEAVHSYDLIGYVKNGDTVGTVYPDDFLLEGMHQQGPLAAPVLYPNPCHDLLLFSGMQNTGFYTYYLYDLTGREIQHGRLNSRLDVSGITAGSYLLKILNQDGTKSWTRPLIKQ
jgi:hypothetical protein